MGRDLEAKKISIYFYAKKEIFDVDFLKNGIEKFIKLPVEIGYTIPLPQGAFNEKRKQFRAEFFTEDLLKIKKNNSIVLGLVDEDLYVEGLNFVFGLADSLKGTAVVAVKRLREEFYGRNEDKILFMNRVLKECVHEIGHLFGLPHCNDPYCIMFFSNTLGDTDRKGLGFCKRCTKKLKELKIY